MRYIRLSFFLVIVSSFFLSCNTGDEQSNAGKNSPVFELVPSSETHINFNNTIKEDEKDNILQYEYIYNGGGVAVGDVNDDGLDDIYFTGNQTPDKLYINKGDLKFEDVTDDAGVAGRTDGWKTGVTMADVNADGRPDIYVSNDYQEPDCLYMNNGNTE